MTAAPTVRRDAVLAGLCSAVYERDRQRREAAIRALSHRCWRWIEWAGSEVAVVTGADGDVDSVIMVFRGTEVSGFQVRDVLANVGIPTPWAGPERRECGWGLFGVRGPDQCRPAGGLSRRRPMRGLPARRRGAPRPASTNGSVSMDLWQIADWIIGLGAWAGLIATAIVGVVLWRMWPVFAPRHEVEAVRADIRSWRDQHVAAHGDITARLDRGEARFQRLESRIEGLPTHADLTALTTMVGEVSAQTREIGARLDGLAELTKRLDRSLDLLTEDRLAQGRDRRENGS
ncbi:DUF2730 family protein [Roseospira marina]|uniref:DUF2730 family protein n=2 Tax=Roseospira marina TaxID=140057 RepID=A0A5M6I683_9PROT|nr:DUF2730 family protein [Roseospira marina]KAA5603761.1 DUF2730 family protein [Roseospira marina]MBB4316048.1 hypothetical protein [Roseospira marina]MBB5089234.1 hypothetical protein [Roseospira marina]